MEHKSNQKERRSLMSVNGNEGVNGEVPVTPVKREQSDTEKQVSGSFGDIGSGVVHGGRRY